MKKFALIITGIVLICGMAHASKEFTDDAEIRGTFIAYDRLWAKHNPAAIAQLWGDNGICISPDGTVAHGRSNIQALTVSEHTGKYKKAKIKTEVGGVRILKDGWAYVEGSTTVTNVVDKNGENMPDEVIPFTALMAKQNGQWMLMDARPTALLNKTTK